jgi:nicotinamidase/pyrazinamidase
MNALIIIDMQNDFMEGGALAVPGAKNLVPLINELQARFDYAVATQDWHPAEHASFAANHPAKNEYDVVHLHGQPQVLWPVHCVQSFDGAEFVAGLDQTRWAAAFQKGIDPEIDSYSGFFDNGKRRATGLADWLARHQVDEVYIAGVATDYCVKFTALDAVGLGLKAHVIEDACRGVNLTPGDVDRALEEMKQAGVWITHSTVARPLPLFTRQK